MAGREGSAGEGEDEQQQEYQPSLQTLHVELQEQARVPEVPSRIAFRQVVDEVE